MTRWNEVEFRVDTSVEEEKDATCAPRLKKSPALNFGCFSVNGGGEGAFAENGAAVFEPPAFPLRLLLSPYPLGGCALAREKRFSTIITSIADTAAAAGRAERHDLPPQLRKQQPNGVRAGSCSSSTATR